MNVQLQEVKSMLGQLRLSGAREQLEELLITAKGRVHLAGVHRRLLNHEVKARNANSRRRMKQARFLSIKLWRSSIWVSKSVSKHQILQLMDMWWVEKASIYFSRPSSIGKTHLSISLAYER